MGTPGRIRNMKMISECPAEADDRTVAGHWEGDLIIGQDGRSAVGTLVERTTRVVLLLHLPDGREATKVTVALKKPSVGCLNTSGAVSPGTRGGRWPAMARSLPIPGCRSYFCDPHSPWQRPLNENTNGLLRQYMPKGTDLSLHSADDLARIAKSLNDRPRKVLGYMTPSEKFAELLALTG